MAKTNNIGIAGEYALVSELIKRGYVACITDKNTPRFDILASNQEGTKFVTIQVKTKGAGKREDFILNEKDEFWSINKNFDCVFYAFVRLNSNGNSYKFVKAQNVSACIYKKHAEWLNDKAAKRQRNDSSMRIAHPEKDFPEIKENNFEDLGL